MLYNISHLYITRILLDIPYPAEASTPSASSTPTKPCRPVYKAFLLHKTPLTGFNTFVIVRSKNFVFQD